MSERKEWRLKVEGMTCDHCAQSIDQMLGQIHGVIESTTSYANGNARVLSENSVGESALVSSIEDAGYQVKSIRPGNNGKTSVNGQQTDLVVIGGGSAAFAAAIKANELGAKVAMINSGLPIGGTCVNVGCVPSKTLIRAAETSHRANHHNFHGIETQGRVTDFHKIIQQKTALVEQLRQAKYLDVVSGQQGVRIIDGMARLVAKDKVEVGSEIIQADHILIATGATTNVPQVAGLAETGYLTNETAFELEQLPESLIVLGGRYIALEMAQMFSRFGSRVTVLQRSPRILPTETEDLTSKLTGYLVEEGVEVVTGVTLSEVSRENNGVLVKAIIEGSPAEFRASQILIATGRKPNTGGMGLEEVGVSLDHSGFLAVDSSMRTNVKEVFGAGDVVGEPMFVYTAAYEGALAAENAISGSSKKTDYTVLPWVIFTDPQVAGVGMDENQALESGIDAEAATLNLEHVPRSLAARDTRGFIKLIRDRTTDRLVGARILAPEGSELLMEISLAIKYGITTTELASSFHPYLTLAEGVKLAAITFNKDVAALSCCSV